MPRSRKALFDLTGKIVLILGGEGLIGKALCRELFALGAVVIDADIRLKGFTVARERGRTRACCHVDLNSDSSLESVLKQSEKIFGAVEVLVNTTYPKGKGFGKAFWEVGAEDLCHDLVLHAGGCFRASQAVARRMVRNKVPGSIIHFGSIYGVTGPSFSIYEGTSMTMPPDYAIIKGGIIQFTRYLASYLGPHGIRVNCVSPGGVQDRQPARFIHQYSRRVPLGRMATPADIVGPVAFLASDASRYITGHNLLVDGGWTAV